MVLAIELLLRNIPNSYNTKRKLLENNSQSLQVLALGSSHQFFGLNPKDWPQNTLNLADVSQDAIYDGKIIEKYADRLPSLRLVILEISYHTLPFSSLDQSLESWRMYYYYQYWGIKPDSFDYKDIKYYSAIALYTPAKTVDFARHFFQMNLAENVSDKGWLSEKNCSDPYDTFDPFHGGPNVVGFHHAYMNQANIPKNLSSYQRIIEKLTKKGIRVVIVTLPVFKTYSENINAQYYEAMLEGIKTLEKNSNVSYSNYFTDSRFQRSDFCDNHHLNADGASKFSQILYEDSVKKFFQ